VALAGGTGGGYRQQAIAQLQPFTAHPVQAWPALLPDVEAHFELVLANHVFTMSQSRCSAGRHSARFNPLWPFPHGYGRTEQHTDSILELLFCPQLGSLSLSTQPKTLRLPWPNRERVTANKRYSTSLVFPDAEENRLKILRFLLGSYFDEVPRQAMVDLFNPYAHAGRIVIQTVHEQFVIWRQEKRSEILGSYSHW